MFQAPDPVTLSNSNNPWQATTELGNGTSGATRAKRAPKLARSDYRLQHGIARENLAKQAAGPARLGYICRSTIFHHLSSKRR